MQSKLEEILQNYKYKSVGLEHTVSSICILYFLVIDTDTKTKLIELLVDYKFNISVRLSTACSLIDGLLLPLQEASINKLRPTFKGRVTPVFNTEKIVNDLKTLGILHKGSNFQLEFKTTTSVPIPEYIFELKAPDTLTNSIHSNCPSIYYNIPPDKYGALDSSLVASYLYSALIATVEDYKLGNYPNLVYNNFNVNIHYTEVVGRIPQYEIYQFSKAPPNNFINYRFTTKP